MPTTRARFLEEINETILVSMRVHSATQAPLTQTTHSEDEEPWAGSRRPSRATLDSRRSSQQTSRSGKRKLARTISSSEDVTDSLSSGESPNQTTRRPWLGDIDLENVLPGDNRNERSINSKYRLRNAQRNAMNDEEPPSTPPPHEPEIMERPSLSRSKSLAHRSRPSTQRNKDLPKIAKSPPTKPGTQHSNTKSQTGLKYQEADFVAVIGLLSLPDSKHSKILHEKMHELVQEQGGGEFIQEWSLEAFVKERMGESGYLGDSEGGEKR